MERVFKPVYFLLQVFDGAAVADNPPHQESFLQHVLNPAYMCGFAWVGGALVFKGVLKYLGNVNFDHGQSRLTKAFLLVGWNRVGVVDFKVNLT